MRVSRAFFVPLPLFFLACAIFQDDYRLPISGVRFEAVADPAGEDRWQGVPFTINRGSGDCEDGASVEVVAAMNKGHRAWLMWLGHYVDYMITPNHHVFGPGQMHVVAIMLAGNGKYYCSGVNACDNFYAKDIDAIAGILAPVYNYNFYQAIEITPEIKRILEKNSPDIGEELENAGLKINYFKFVFLDSDLERKREETKKKNHIK